MNKNKAIHLLLSLLFFLLVYGCGKNERESIIVDDDEISTYGVEYVINAQNSMDPYATEEELMKTLLLVIVDQHGEIEELFDRELPQMVQQCTVNTHLTPGEKDVYGFANLTQDMRIAVGLDNLAVGQTMPDISTTTLSLVNGYQIDSSQKKWLPMSNRIKYTVTRLSTQRFSMPLFRLVCKVAFTFKNETGYHTTLKQLSLAPLTNTDGYHCHFSGGGPFIIIPSLIRLSDNSVIEIDKDDWTLTYTNASPTLFDEAPVLKNGENRGSLKTGSSGNALFTISAEITTSANISRVLSYKVYIS